MHTKIPFYLSSLKQFFKQHVLYLALETVDNNKNKKSIKFQGDVLNFNVIIKVFVFITNHHLKNVKFSNLYY